MRPVTQFEIAAYLLVGVLAWLCQHAEAGSKAASAPRHLGSLLALGGTGASRESRLRAVLMAGVVAVAITGAWWGSWFFPLAGVVALSVIAWGPHRIPPLRRLRPDHAVSWLAVAALCFATAWTLSPDPNTALTSHMLARQPTAWDLAETYLLMAVVGVFAVGAGARRNWKDVAERLGFIRIRIPILIGTMLLGFILFFIGRWADQQLLSLEPASCLNQVQALANRGNIAAQGELQRILLVTCVALGEDILFRGAVQPRMGIAAGAALSALLTVYTCSGRPSLGQLYIFCLAYIFGLIRKKWGLGASMLTHGVYNYSLFVTY